MQLPGIHFSCMWFILGLGATHVQPGLVVRNANLKLEERDGEIASKPSKETQLRFETELEFDKSGN